ncbi:MAG: transglutaminase-like domain-containing protein [Acetobacteraceae bacterium]|nr:transglutaminase-like domain-containing protein [Acetobacteraceae bacterium]
MLAELGRAPASARLDLARAALLFAALDQGGADLAAALAHLDEMALAARAMAPMAAGDSAAAAAGLAGLLADHFGYLGDSETYDDLANANLLRVIERRRGLPVALGILWIHAARAAGFEAKGANMPAHFLVGLDAGSGPVILDPFDRGRVVSLEEVGQRLAAIEPEGGDFVLRPMTDRDVLLRLENNVWQRRAQAGDVAGAIARLDDMALIAPEEPYILREAARLHVESGSLRGAIACLERLLPLAPDPQTASGTRALIEELKAKLN